MVHFKKNNGYFLKNNICSLAVSHGSFYYSGQSGPLFVLFSTFSHSNIKYSSNLNICKLKKVCAWDLNPGLQDGRHSSVANLVNTQLNGKLLWL